MTTATHTETRPHHRADRRRTSVLAMTLVAAVVLAGPAAAQPTGPSDELIPVPAPTDDPEAVLRVTPGCDPERVDYEVEILDGLGERPFTVRVDWSSEGPGPGGSGTGQAGSIATGEGAFQFVAVVTYPQVITLDHQVLAAVSVSSPPEAAAVECDEPDEPGGSDGFDPDVRTATPTFTG
jgi:hypothetical protein